MPATQVIILDILWQGNKLGSDATTGTRRPGCGHLIFDHFDRHIPLYLALATQTVGVIGHTHVLLPVVSGAKVSHSLLHFAHAGGAETVAAAGVLHRDIVIERDLKDRFTLLCLDLTLLAGYDECHLGHRLEY